MASILLLSVALFALIGVSQSDVSDCKVSISGHDYDLSPLKKEYTWNQTVISTAQNLLTNPDFSDMVNISLQLGICQNIDTPMPGCSGTAPLFMMRQDTKKCVALGSIDAAKFEPNPFQDGVYLDYYDGDMIDHITRYEARIYFVCNSNVTIEGPLFEHLKESQQAHFHVFTKYAC